MKIRAYMESSLDGNEFHVDIEVDDKATVEEVEKEVKKIAEQNYVKKVVWGEDGEQE